MSLVRLRAATVRDLAGVISVPGYDRGRLQVGIVHFGVGRASTAPTRRCTSTG